MNHVSITTILPVIQELEYTDGTKKTTVWPKFWIVEINQYSEIFRSEIDAIDVYKKAVNHFNL